MLNRARFAALLLDRGASVHAVLSSARGLGGGFWTDLQAIDLAIWNGRRPGDRRTIRLLLEHGPLAGRLVREVGALARRAGVSGKRLPTLTIDTQIGFRSAADRAAFADDLTAAVLDLAARYHHDDGRPHRLVVAAHPLPEESA